MADGEHGENGRNVQEVASMRELRPDLESVMSLNLLTGVLNARVRTSRKENVTNNTAQVHKRAGGCELP